MRIKNRLTPYPILDNFSDDYVESSFSVEYDVKAQFAEIYGGLTFKLDNEDIRKLVEEEKAQYVVHIECPVTCYRKVISSCDSFLEFKLDSKEISKMIEIRTFVVLTSDIDDFYSEKFHPDYLNQKFKLKAHQIIAIGTAKNFDIKKDDRDLDSLPSIIEITKLASKKKGSITVNTDQDNKIIIGLTEDVYELYGQLGKSAYKSTAFSLVLLPAMIIVIQRMHDNKDDVDVNSRHWFQVINSMLEANGFKLDNISLDNDSLLMICQSIFSDPIARSFKELDKSSERME